MKKKLRKVFVSSKKTTLVFQLSIAILLFCCTLSFGQVNMTTSTTTYSQDFNTLNDNSPGSNVTWTDNVTIEGWYANQTNYRTWSTGEAAPTNRIWSCGVTNGNGERALGARMSSTTVRAWGIALKNQSGASLSSINIGFDAELYIKGGTGNNLVVQYSTTSTNVGDAVASASWTEIASIPASSTASVTGLTYTLAGLNLAIDATVYIRWISVYSGSSSNYTLWATDNFTATWGTGSLPTTFVQVAAQQKGSAIEVTFNTANETNMHNYEVEESKDGSNFSKGTTVEAKNAATNNYSWLDVNIYNGNNYYRVKAIEKNGAVKYSQVVRVNIGKQTAAFTVYPNPVKGGTINLQLTDIEKGVYIIKVINNLGQEIAAKQITHNGGSATRAIHIGNAPTGKYNMVITNGTSIVTKTVIVE
ncbi:MAG: T9SS type A sorting domain-containing protein [Chitinophagaceae bacterium]|jgi:hypothetical protein|nr:T9SS type A sorting domain-containing protein [Chitinophagaceae bacterium]